jgi:hypothetical protein
MRYWFDTEFIEDGKTIDLISIGVVAEDGREYYAVNLDCEVSKASQWVKDNVIAQLPPPLSSVWKRKNAIRADVAFFLGCEQINPLQGFEYILPAGVEKPEIWAYYADYDWVAFCQLFGTMMDLPKGFPMYCRDLKQEVDRLGLINMDLPAPEGQESMHHALHDARWTKRAWESLEARQ